MFCRWEKMTGLYRGVVPIGSLFKLPEQFFHFTYIHVSLGINNGQGINELIEFFIALDVPGTQIPAEALRIICIVEEIPAGLFYDVVVVAAQDGTPVRLGDILEIREGQCRAPGAVAGDRQPGVDPGIACNPELS